MKYKLFVAGLVVAAFVFGTTAYAHHSVAATYVGDKTITVEGTLVQFMFRNPHSFVTIEGKDENGKMQRWGVEWGGAGQLGGQGVKRDTLKAGDHVIISGNPGRDPSEHRIRMLSVKRPSDGFGWGGRPSETFD
jgi:hypothetical protein